METLNDILAELQTLDQTVLEGVVAGLNQAITDVQAIIAASVPTVGPVVSITTTFQSGAVAEFVPKV